MSYNPRTHSPARPTRRTMLGGLAATAGAVGLAACGDGGDSDNSSEEGILKILVLKHPLTKPMSEMKWAKKLEEIAGMDIKWEEVSADWDQKKSTMLAAGDVPDLIVGTNAVTDTDLATYGTLFADLKDELDNIPNVSAMFDALPDSLNQATQTSGEVFSIPGYKRFWPETSSHQYINRKWLNELDLDMPTTWDELFDVLVAFKEGDPNKTGDPKTVIPIDWSPVGTGGFGYFQPTLMLGGTGLPTRGGGGSGYYLEDGTVKTFFTNDRYKQLIAFLAKCKKAGLISEKAMTQDYSAYQSAGRGPGDGVASIGFTWGWTRSDRFGPEIADQYEAMPVLTPDSDYDGPLAWSYDQYQENFPANQVCMSAQTKNKDAALKVIDAFYDEERSLEVLFGDVGPNIEKTGDKSYKILPAEDGTDPSTWKWTSSLADNGPMWIRDDLKVELPTDMQEALEETKPLKPAFKDMDLEKDVYPNEFIKMSKEDLNAMTLVDTTLLNTTMTKFGEWITKGGIEDQWDDYVATVEKSGVKDNIEKMQKYYDDYMKNK